MEKKAEVSYDETFARLDIRTGTVIGCEYFSRAKKPSYKLAIDFGPLIGILPSSAQITIHYSPEQLIGMTIIGVVNFAPRNIAGFISRALVLGVYDEDGAVILLQSHKEMPNGSVVG